MWLFTKNSFISVVQHRQQPDNVLVRARVRKHLEKLFPHRGKEIYADSSADYKYRLLISKRELSEVVSDYILCGLDYDNFKAAQGRDDPAWARFLSTVWAAGVKCADAFKKRERKYEQWDLFTQQPIAFYHPELEGARLFLAGVARFGLDAVKIWYLDYMVSVNMPDGMPGSGHASRWFSNTPTFDARSGMWIIEEGEGIFRFDLPTAEEMREFEELRQYVRPLADLQKSADDEYQLKLRVERENKEN